MGSENTIGLLAQFAAINRNKKFVCETLGAVCKANLATYEKKNCIVLRQSKTLDNELITKNRGGGYIAHQILLPIKISFDALVS